jgi:hypothetical protein
MTKDHGVAVLISKPAVDAATATGEKLPPLRSLGQASVRGRAEPLEIYCFPDDGFSHDVTVDPISAEHAAQPKR